MTTDVDFADTQAYLQHFRNRGCDTGITDNTEGLFNLFWFNVGLIDELKQELEKKTVSIVRLQEIIFGPGAIPETSDNDGGAEAADTAPGTDNEAPDREDRRRKKKSKGHGRRGVNDYPGAEVVACQHHDLKARDTCPLCQQGLMEPRQPKVRVQFDGATPLTATRFELEQLGCTRCPLGELSAATLDPKILS